MDLSFLRKRLSAEICIFVHGRCGFKDAAKNCQRRIAGDQLPESKVIGMQKL